MNQKIKNLDYSKLLFVDIETVRGCNDFDENHPYYDVWAWKQRNKETNEIPEAKEVINLYNNKAALFAEWGKIVCISVGYIHQEELHITSYTGDEKDILTSYVDMMKRQARMAVGHNIIPFDNNFIRKRWFINGLGEYLSDKQGNDVYMKPWDLDNSIFDTMVAWKGSGFTNTSLEELAMAFNIPSSKDKMHGNEVSDYFYAGKIAEIQEYCEKDVAVVANIIRRWKGDKILEPLIKKQVEIKEPTVLEKLYATNQLTDNLKKDIEKLTQKKKLTTTDKKNLVKILLSVYQAKGDKVAVKKEKQTEVEEFIKTL